MEENKGIFKKIQEVLTRIFRKEKYKELPMARTENNNKTQENEISVEEEKNEFKENIANISKEEKKILDSIENFSFPANLDGYKFISGISIEKDSPIGAYVCYMLEENNINIEDGLPICCIENKDKLKIVEDYLNELKDIKEEYGKDSIKDIIENGFILNDEERFSVDEDYHLTSLLKGIINSKDKDETIKIPIAYVCKTVKGYIIEQSPRVIEMEKLKKKKQEAENEKFKYLTIIKSFIFQGKPINLQKMSKNQKSLLEHYYRHVISNLENNNLYLDLAIEYVTNVRSKEDSRYSQIISYYDKLKDAEQLKKGTKNNEKGLNLLLQKEKIERIIKNELAQKFKENLDIFNTQDKVNEREN